MHQVISGDGTRIACTPSGNGRPVVLIDGALGSRSFGAMPKLSALLAARHISDRLHEDPVDQLSPVMWRG